MSANSIVESFPPSNLRRSSNDVLLKHVTLLNAQTQKTLSKMTIPKVLVLYTGSNLEELFQTNLENKYIYIVGGTIGMKVLRNAYEPVTNFLPDALREMNIMHNIRFAETMNEIDPEKSFLYLPLSLSNI
jgi:hypothetical protein